LGDEAGKKDTPPGLGSRLRLRGSIARPRLSGSIGPRSRISPPPYRPATPNSSAASVRKLAGKQWVPVAYARRADELRTKTITEAGRLLSIESKTALDCEQLSRGYCTNELRKLGVWTKKPRKPQRQRPK
jgi:hypothetical protein